MNLNLGTLEIEVARGEMERLLLDGQTVFNGIDLRKLSGQHRLRLEILRKRGCASGENHV